MKSISNQIMNKFLKMQHWSKFNLAKKSSIQTFKYDHMKVFKLINCKLFKDEVEYNNFFVLIIAERQIEKCKKFWIRGGKFIILK